MTGQRLDGGYDDFYEELQAAYQVDKYGLSSKSKSLRREGRRRQGGQKKAGWAKEVRVGDAYNHNQTFTNRVPVPITLLLNLLSANVYTCQ